MTILAKSDETFANETPKSDDLRRAIDFLLNNYPNGDPPKYRIAAAKFLAQTLKTRDECLGRMMAESILSVSTALRALP